MLRATFFLSGERVAGRGKELFEMCDELEAMIKGGSQSDSQSDRQTGRQRQSHG